MKASVEQELLEQLDMAEARFEAREPSVLAFLPEADRFGRARREAAALLASNPGRKPDLFGMTFGIKDIFHVDGFETHAGSRLPAEALRGPEAESVTCLKQAGALILGKTVTTEFAYFAPGPTRNPHNPEHTPGGSSSGSAAAVGAGLCDAALGTQTIGSVIRPASFCGVVGLKPTYDRISREGVIPLSPSLDHVGMFTRDVVTVRRIASAVYKDWNDSIEAGRRPVLGIPQGPYLECAPDSALAWFRTICTALTDAGYELRRVPVLDDFPEVRARHDVILAAEVAQVHQMWFEKYADLYAPKTAELIRRGQAIAENQLQDALYAREEFRAELRRVMIDHDIDLWVCPSTLGPAPKGLESTGDPVMNLPWTQAGLPALNLPAGRSPDGLPLGLQLVANWHKDESLLLWAQELEKVTGRL